MNIKLSHIALVLMASTSFSYAATVIPGSAVTIDTDINISQPSAFSVLVVPITGLTVEDIKRGETTNVANFTVTGTNVGIHMLNPATLTHCTSSFGTSNTANKIDFCLKGIGSVSQKFVSGGKVYYEYSAGSHFIISSDKNKTSTTVGADTYKVSLEAVQYTL